MKKKTRKQKELGRGGFEPHGHELLINQCVTTST